MNEVKCEYDRWLSGTFKVGRFQAQLFQAYQFADGDNRLKLKAIFPGWFNTPSPQAVKGMPVTTRHVHTPLLNRKGGFLNRYHCAPCNNEWDSTWSGFRNDVCHGCNAEIKPFESMEIVSEEERSIRDSLSWVIHRNCGRYLTDKQQEDLIRQLALWLEVQAKPVDWLYDPNIGDSLMAVPISWLAYPV